MRPLGELLGDVLRKTGSAQALQPLWTQAVGEVLARHTSPLRWDGDRLVIACQGAAWQAALEPDRAALAQRLSALLGGQPVTDIILEVR